MQRGKEYLEDSSAARQLQMQELQAHKNKKICELIEKRDNLFANALSLRESGNAMKNYDHDFSTLTDAIKAEQNKPLDRYAFELKIPLPNNNTPITQVAGASQNLIHQSLGLAKGKEFKSLARAQPLRSFTDQEMKKISEHHGKLEPNLQKLMDAAISDDQFTLEFIANPVFIPRDGHVYDKKVLEDFLAAKNGKANCPLNQEISFTATDITPCNTLIRATEQLLNIIETEGKIAPVKDKPKYATLEQKAQRKRIPEILIPIIEKFYSQMEDKHKLLFDIVCRDPVSGQIMDDPVLLPDGHVYDRTIAMYLLKYERGECRLDPAISFTEKDITPCHFVVKVLFQLKENIETAIKLQQQNAAPALSKEEALKLREKELSSTIEKLKKELDEVRSELRTISEVAGFKKKII
jgi:hypothetical protein